MYQWRACARNIALKGFASKYKSNCYIAEYWNISQLAALKYLLASGGKLNLSENVIVPACVTHTGIHRFNIWYRLIDR